MTAPFELIDVRLDHPRGGAPLVAGATLRVAAGEVVLVVGAAGVGTSRLVAAALGECPVASGELRVLGRDVRKLRRSSLRLLRRRVGIVPEDLCLLEDRSAQLNVVLPLEIDGIPRAISVARAAEGLASMGLADVAAVQVDVLPASVRQRVAVARALVRDPDLVLADHPTSAQDADGCAQVAAALEAAARDRGKAVLVFARDPLLRAYADAHAWRQLALIDGELRPLGEIVLDSGAIDSSLVDSESLPNLVPFPPARQRRWPADHRPGRSRRHADQRRTAMTMRTLRRARTLAPRNVRRAAFDPGDATVEPGPGPIPEAVFDRLTGPFDRRAALPGRLDDET